MSVTIGVGEVLPPNPDSSNNTELLETVARLQAAVDYLLRTGDDPAAFDVLVSDEELAAQVAELQEWVTSQINAAIAPLDSLYVNAAGDTMSGLLQLSGDPVGPLHAVTKQYADTLVGALATTVAGLDALYVNTAGDTMAGALALPADPTDPAHAVTKQYVDNATASIIAQIPPPGLDEADVQNLVDIAILNLQGTLTGAVTNVDVSAGNATISGATWDTTDTYNVIGATVNGRTVTMPASVIGTRTIASARTNTRSVRIIKGTTSYTLAAGAFAIVYLDGSANYMRVIAAGGASADYVLRSGDTMAGALQLAADPVTALGAVTKQYADTLAGALDARLDSLESRTFGIGVAFAGVANRITTIPRPFPLTVPAGTYVGAIEGTATATASTAYTVRKNGVTIGTATVPLGALKGDLVVPTGASFLTTDTMTVVEPSTLDVTFANPTLTIPYTR